MKMRDHEERVVNLKVERHRRQHHAAQTAQDEDKEETEHEQQRRLEYGPSGPQRRDPAEDLHAARDRDHHARGGEETLTELWHICGKHVMHPQPETNKSRRDQREDERQITEDRAARERAK